MAFRCRGVGDVLAAGLPVPRPRLMSACSIGVMICLGSWAAPLPMVMWFRLNYRRFLTLWAALLRGCFGGSVVVEDLGFTTS